MDNLYSLVDAYYKTCSLPIAYMAQYATEKSTTITIQPFMFLVTKCKLILVL